jgi:hypothetical protein
MPLFPASGKMLNCAFGSPRASSNELNDDHHVVIAIDDRDKMLNPRERHGITHVPGAWIAVS